MGMTNTKRADWAQIALASYSNQKIVGAPTDNGLYDSVELIISDLIGDLAHLMNQSGIEVDEAIERAKFNYHAELEEEGV